MGQIVQRQPLMDGALKLVVLAVRLLNGGMNPFLRGRLGRRSVGDPAAFFQAVQPVEIGFFLAGPVGYLTDIFRPGVASREEARLLALAFYGPMFLLYSLYDSGERNAAALLDRHMARFAKEHPALPVRTQKEG